MKVDPQREVYEMRKILFEVQSKIAKLMEHVRDIEDALNLPPPVLEFTPFSFEANRLQSNPFGDTIG